jgi:hypothetical protein
LIEGHHNGFASHICPGNSEGRKGRKERMERKDGKEGRKEGI